MALQMFTPTSPRRVRLRRSGSSSGRRRLEELFRTPRSSVERMDVSGVARDLLMTVDLKDDQMVQTKCFTNWANSYLAKRNPPVTIFNLFEEMKDGINLLYLLEVLSGEELVPDKDTGTGVQAVRKGRDMTLSDKVTNAKASLAYLEDNGVKIPAGVTPQEITNGTPPKILDLMWAIVSHYQIEEVAKMSRRTVSGLNASMGDDSMYGTMPRTSSQSTTPTKGGKFGFSGSSSSLPSLGKRKKSSRDQSPGPNRKKSGKETKEAQKILLKWSQNAVDRRVVDVKDFSKSWRNGKAFSSLVHTIQPDLVDMPRLSTKSASSRMEHAFTAAERFLGIPKLIDSEDVDVDRPDGRSVMTYVSLFAQAFPQAGGWTAPTPSQRDVRYLGLGSGNTSSFRRAGSARGTYGSSSGGGGAYVSTSGGGGAYSVGGGDNPSVSVTEFQSTRTTEVTSYEQNTQLSSYEQSSQLAAEDSYRTSDVTSDSLYDDVMNEVGAGGTFSGQRFKTDVVMNGSGQEMQSASNHLDVQVGSFRGESAAGKGGRYSGEFSQQSSQQTSKGGGYGGEYEQSSAQVFTYDNKGGQSQSTSVRSSALMEDGSSPTVVMANKGDMSPIRVSINLPSYAGRRGGSTSKSGGASPGEDEYSRGLGNIRGWLADVEKEYPKDIMVYHQDVQEHIEDLETLDTEAGKQEDKLSTLSRQVDSVFGSRGDEARVAKSDLNDVQEEITRIRNDVSKEKNNCTRMLPYVKRFEDDTAEIDNWLSDAEKLMMSHMVDSTSAKFNQRVQNHKEFFTTRNTMRNKLSSCNSDLKKIEGLCLDNHDKSPLQTRFDDIDSRFEDGMALSLTWDDKLDDIQENWRDFDKRTDDVGSWLDKANDIMTDRDQPLDIQIARHEMLVTFFKDVDSDMMEGLVQSGERLAEDMNDPEKEQLQDQMGRIENKWKDVMYQAPIALMKLKFRKSQDLYRETVDKANKETDREYELLVNPSVDRDDLRHTHEGLYLREPEGFIPTAERHVSDMENYSRELVQYSVDEMSLVGPAKDNREHFEGVRKEQQVLWEKLRNARTDQEGKGPGGYQISTNVTQVPGGHGGQGLDGVYGPKGYPGKGRQPPDYNSVEGGYGIDGNQQPQRYGALDRGGRYGGVPSRLSYQYPRGYRRPDKGYRYGGVPFNRTKQPVEDGKQGKGGGDADAESSASDTPSDQQPPKEEKQEIVEPEADTVTVAVESSDTVPADYQTPVEQKEQENIVAEDNESSATVPASDQQPAEEEENEEKVEAEADCSVTDMPDTQQAAEEEENEEKVEAEADRNITDMPDKQQPQETGRPDKGAGYHGASSGDTPQQLPDSTDSGGGGASDATIFATVIPKVQPHAVSQDRWSDNFPTHKPPPYPGSAGISHLGNVSSTSEYEPFSHPGRNSDRKDMHVRFAPDLETPTHPDKKYNLSGEPTNLEAPITIVVSEKEGDAIVVSPDKSSWYKGYYMKISNPMDQNISGMKGRGGEDDDRDRDRDGLQRSGDGASQRGGGDGYGPGQVVGGRDGYNGGVGGQINIHETIVINEYEQNVYQQGKGGGYGTGSWKTRPEEIERAHRWKQFFEKKEAMLQECTQIDDTLDGEEQLEITPPNVKSRDHLFERLDRELKQNRGETPDLKDMGSWLEREMPHKKDDIVGDIAFVEKAQDETEDHLRRAREEHENLLTRVNDFYECKERTHKCIDRAELVLRSRICQRPADIASQLDKHENAEGELSNNMPKLDLMSKRGTELVQDLRSSNLWKTTEIRKEMDHTSHRWIEVSEQLHDNKDVLRNMENIWDEMYNINSDFEDWFNGPVEDLRKKLYSISDASEVPDMQRRLDLFQDEIIDRENQWTKLNNRAQRLQDLNQNVPISLVERLVQRNKDGIEEAKKLAIEGRRKLDSFKANQDFGRRNLDPLQKWLDKEERLLKAQYDLQMDIYSKKAQRDKFESFSNEIASHRWKFDEVNSKAREVNLSQNPEIVRQLEQINDRYSALKIECDDITKKCEGHVADHSQYDELYDEASEWLKQQREKLREAQQPTTDWKELEEHHANINLLLLTKKRGEIKINNTSERADVTMDNTSADGKPIIIDQVESLRHEFELYLEELNAAKLKVEGQLEGMKPEINRSKLSDRSIAIEQRLDENLSQQSISSTYQYTQSTKTVYGSQTIGGSGGAGGAGGGYGGIGQSAGGGYGGTSQTSGIGIGQGGGYGGISQSAGGGYGGGTGSGYGVQTTSSTYSTSGAGGGGGVSTGVGGSSSINQFLGGGSSAVFDVSVSRVKTSSVTKDIGIQPSPSRQRTSTSTETMTDDLRKKVGDKVFQEIVLQPGERRTFGSGDNVVHYHNSQSEPITVKINYLVNYYE
ncbi:uncharacterized protein LOC118404010 isoform X3 [Branchiostoma floridae]|uniref:Uncharacterized protein LOC118404010 isoform X3 n=1 Tax=Branchiostoma floridae TaxID=7739 RepID=A0A9J7KHL9_BRAFL|nr:uncharacterized protein LOC118404010 isoform X3 [Branchiostoma floridae]